MRSGIGLRMVFFLYPAVRASARADSRPVLCRHGSAVWSSEEIAKRSAGLGASVRLPAHEPAELLMSTMERSTHDLVPRLRPSRQHRPGKDRSRTRPGRTALGVDVNLRDLVFAALTISGVAARPAKAKSSSAPSFNSRRNECRAIGRSYKGVFRHLRGSLAFLPDFPSALPTTLPCIPGVWRSGRLD